MATAPTEEEREEGPKLGEGIASQRGDDELTFHFKSNNHVDCDARS